MVTYVALRTMKVQTDAGQVVLRRRGESIPEAARWVNPQRWIDWGYIKRVRVEPKQQASAGERKPLKRAGKKKTKPKPIAQTTPSIEFLSSDEQEPPKELMTYDITEAE